MGALAGAKTQNDFQLGRRGDAIFGMTFIYDMEIYL